MREEAGKKEIIGDQQPLLCFAGSLCYLGVTFGEFNGQGQLEQLEQRKSKGLLTVPLKPFWVGRHLHVLTINALGAAGSFASSTGSCCSAGFSAGFF